MYTPNFFIEEPEAFMVYFSLADYEQFDDGHVLPHSLLVLDDDEDEDENGQLGGKEDATGFRFYVDPYTDELGGVYTFTINIESDIVVYEP